MVETSSCTLSYESSVYIKTNTATILNTIWNTKGVKKGRYQETANTLLLPFHLWLLPGNLPLVLCTYGYPRENSLRNTDNSDLILCGLPICETWENANSNLSSFLRKMEITVVPHVVWRALLGTQETLHKSWPLLLLSLGCCCFVGASVIVLER